MTQWYNGQPTAIRSETHFRCHPKSHPVFWGWIRQLVFRLISSFVTMA